MSETHQQQMMVFGAAPARVIEGYSDIFLETFMKHMKVRYVHTVLKTQDTRHSVVDFLSVATSKR
jgi:hypothetical protein